MNAALVMFKADGSRREFALRSGATVVGRKNSCDLRIPLTSVSRQHCEFRVDAGGVKLRDLGSSNGTFRNGQRVQEVDLDAGDQVVVGPVLFTLTVDGQPTEVEPTRTVLEPAGVSGAVAAGGAGVAAAAVPPEPEDALGLPPSMEMEDAASSQADAPAADLLDSAIAGDDSGVDLDGPASASPPADAEDDDEIAAAIAGMDGDSDGSSGLAFDFDDDDDGEMPEIELFDDEDDK